jgi:uncharacterized protein YecT (DUF1311 family)
MKIIASYALLTGTMMGLLPQDTVASTFKPFVSVQNSNVGNGRPEPELPNQRPGLLAIEKEVRKCEGTKAKYSPYFNEVLSYDDCLSVVFDRDKAKESRLLRSIEWDLANCKSRYVGFSPKEALSNLKNATRVWPQLVENQCNVVRVTYGEGSDSWREAALCQIEMYKARYQQLQTVSKQLRQNKSTIPLGETYSIVVCK